MEKKNNAIPDFSMNEAMRFAQSDAGQQLLKRLQQNHSDQLQTLMSQAASGDLSNLKNTLSELLKDPDTKKLLNQAQE